jgi:tRNA (guanosine-2'-O-)-methyltransferase
MQNKLFENNPSLRREFIAFLSDFILERRVSQIQNVLEKRTKYITIVLEDIYQSQNASAVLRTCECLGVQDVHIIEGKHNFNINPQVVLGSSKWLTIKKYKKDSNNSMAAIDSLKGDGYRIIASTPHANKVNIESLDLHKGKVALFFGTERTGLSETVFKNADEFIAIPMFGFTESFNISVSAAIILHTLIGKLRDSDIQYHLTPDESEILLLTWLKSTTKNWEMMEKRFLTEKNIK